MKMLECPLTMLHYCRARYNKGTVLQNTKEKKWRKFL